MKRDVRLKPGYLGNQQNARYTLPPDIPTETVCLRIDIPKSMYWYTVFWSQIFGLAKWTAYDYDEDKQATVVATEIRQLLLAAKSAMPRWDTDSTLCNCGECTPCRNRIINERYHVIYEEIEVEMSNLRIENIGGKAYLEQDCGCGVRKYYALSELAVNPDTGAISGELDSPPSYINNVPLTQAQIDSCYSELVADTIIGALTAYTSAVFDFALLGAGAFFPVTTSAIIGAVEIQQSITAALNGDLTLDFSNVGYTANEVVAVFQSAEFRTFIKARIGEDQKISRFALENVALRLLNNNSLNFPTPTYPVFLAWLRMANIAQLNAEFQQAATECVSGNTVPSEFPSVGNLLLTNDWAMSFDLTLAPFATNAWFTLRQDDGNDVGEWIEGVGYSAIANVQEEPHAATRLTMDFTQGTGGDCTITYVDYEYVPLLEESTSRLQTIFDQTFDEDAPFNGIRVVDPVNWTSGDREITLRPYRVLNDTVADGGVGIVRRVALAGTGANPFSGLVQDFS